MPGTEAFAHLVLFLTFGATLWGGFVAGPRRIVPFLIFLGPLFLPAYATYALPGLPDLTRMTAVTIPAVALLLFSPPQCWRRIRPTLPDAFLVAYVAWTVICVSANQGPWAAMSMGAAQFLLLVMPFLIGRLYVQEEADLLVLIRALVPMLVIYFGLMLFEARFYPQIQRMVYGEHILGLYRAGFYRPVVFAQGALELGHTMSMIAVIMIALWRTEGDRIRSRVRTLDMGVVFAIMCVIACLSRGPITGLLLGAFIPKIFRRTAPFSCLLGIAGVVFFFWMLSPGGSSVIVGAALADESTDTGMSLFYRFLQIEQFKPMVEAQPIFGYGESWERTGVIKIIDGILLLVTLGFGYPGAVLLSMFWLSCIWLMSWRPARPDHMFEQLGVHLAPVLGFLMFSAWGDSFLRGPHYLLMGALVGIISARGVGAASPDPNPIRRLVLRTG